MKKIIIVLTCLFLSIGGVKAKINVDMPKVTDHEKVNIYLFRGEGCTHCYDFLTYFSKNYKQFKNYFNIVSYETYNDANNKVLKDKVNDYLETIEKNRGSVPLILVGSWHTLGFVESDGIEIIKEALKAYEDENYVDQVQRIINERELTVNPETLEEACAAEHIKMPNSNKDGIVLLVIFGVLLVGIVGIVIATKKK